MTACARILVIDGDPERRAAVERDLSTLDVAVTGRADGAGIRALLAQTDVGLVVIDAEVRAPACCALIEAIRSVSAVPVIVVGGSETADARIRALELGADDYLCRPFPARELLARVRCVLRRAGDVPPTAGERMLRIGTLTIDPKLGEARGRNGRRLGLTPFELRLLAALAEHADSVLSRDQLSSAVAGRAWSYADRTIDVLVGKLRRKLETSETWTIQSVRGIGYMLRTVPSRVADGGI